MAPFEVPLMMTNDQMPQKNIADDALYPGRVLSPPACGQYYKCFTIVIYDRNDSGQYYKTRITIVIDDPS